MKRSRGLAREKKIAMRRAAIVTTCLSVLLLFMGLNTGLALTLSHRCVVAFSVPFANKLFLLPDWMWGGRVLLLGAVSTLAALALWTGFFVKRWRNRRASESLK